MTHVHSSDILNANQKASTGEQVKLGETEALDLVTLESNDKELTVGRERHKFCDPLFDPRVLKHIPELEVTLFGHDEKEKEQDSVSSVSEAAQCPQQGRGRSTAVHSR